MPAFASPLTAVQFRDLFAVRAEKVIQNPTTMIDERTFKTISSDGTELTINVENAYAAYLGDEAKLEDVIERYLATLVSSQKTAMEALDQLVVIVRPTDYIKRSLQVGSSSDNFIAPRDFAGDLSIFLAVDSPISLRSASPDDLKRWKIDEPSAWKRALDNHQARVGPIRFVRLGNETGAQGVGADSGLAPSMLAQPSLCSEQKPSGISNQIVLLYSKDIFLFALPADEQMMTTFWSVVKSEIATGRSLSNTPFTCQNGRWAVVPIPN